MNGRAFKRATHGGVPSDGLWDGGGEVGCSGIDRSGVGEDVGGSVDHGERTNEVRNELETSWLAGETVRPQYSPKNLYTLELLRRANGNGLPFRLSATPFTDDAPRFDGKPNSGHELSLSAFESELQSRQIRIRRWLFLKLALSASARGEHNQLQTPRAWERPRSQ